MSDAENIEPDSSQRRRSLRRKTSTAFFGRDTVINIDNKANKRDDDDDLDVISDSENEDKPLKYKNRRKKVMTKVRSNDECSTSDSEHQSPVSRKRGKKVISKRKPNVDSRETKSRKREPRQSRKTNRKASNAKDTGLADDNLLFNALRREDDLELLSQNVVTQYAESSAVCIANLVNCFLRACGCNGAITEDQAQDLDGIISTLEDLQNEYKHESTHVYPLIAKTKDLRHFRPRMIKFLDTFIDLMSQHGHLYDDIFCESAQSWIIAMSSSSLRSFRHTATVIALCLMTSICKLDQSLQNDEVNFVKQKQAEQKKKRVNEARLEQVESLLSRVSPKRARLRTYMGEIFDAVFVHRYRDSDPILRSECAQELGKWIIICPDYFMNGSYLRYLGWTLSDKEKSVRLASIKALVVIFSTDDDLNSQLKQFAERFRNRICEMASFDIDVTVRVQAIIAVTHLHDHQILQQSHESRLLPVLFQEDERVRNTIRPFVADYIEEDAKKECKVKSQLNLYVIKRLLEFLQNQADQDSSQDQEGNNEEAMDVSMGVGVIADRIEIAIASLLPVMDALQDFKSLNWFAQFDHSKRMGQESTEDNNNIPEDLRLDEKQEKLLLQTMVVAFQTAGTTENNKKVLKKKDHPDGEEYIEQMTTQIIDILPKLLTRYGADAECLVHILRLISHMKLSQYIDLRKKAEYEIMLDEINKKFQIHTKKEVLAACIRVYSHADEVEALQAINATKRAQLVEDLTREIIARSGGNTRGPKSTTITEDNLHVLSFSLLRLSMLLMSFDCIQDMEEVSIMDVCIRVLRIGGGTTDSSQVLMISAIRIFQATFMWELVQLRKGSNGMNKITQLRETQSAVVQELTNVCIGAMSNANETVKLEAFRALLDMFLIFRVEIPFEANNLEFVVTPDLQTRCAAFLQTIIDANLDDKSNADEKEKDDKQVRVLNPRIISLMHVIAEYTRLVQKRIFSFTCLAPIFANFGRVITVYDVFVKTAAEKIKTLVNANGHVAMLFASALESTLEHVFELYFDEKTTLDNCLAVCRLLASMYPISSNVKVRAFVSKTLLKVGKNASNAVFTKISAYQRVDNHEAQTKACDIFSGIGIYVDGKLIAKDARLLLEHLDASMREKGIEEPLGEQYESLRENLTELAGENVVNEIGKEGEMINDVQDPENTENIDKGKEILRKSPKRTRIEAISGQQEGEEIKESFVERSPKRPRSQTNSTKQQDEEINKEVFERSPKRTRVSSTDKEKRKDKKTERSPKRTKTEAIPSTSSDEQKSGENDDGEDSDEFHSLDEIEPKRPKRR